MASKFWIKLYMEILDDPKMGNLPDNLFRRSMEMFLLAGDCDKGGELPPEKDIAWRLRTCYEVITNDVTELVKLGILERHDNKLFVTNYNKRQGEIPAKLRMKRYREQEKKRNYYGTVTNRNTDKIRLDKNRIDEIKTDKEVDVNDHINELGELSNIFTELTHIEPDNIPEWVDAERRLVKAGITEDDLTMAVVEMQRKPNYVISSLKSIVTPAMQCQGKRIGKLHSQVPNSV